MTDATLERLLTSNRGAVDAFAERAERVPSDRWASAPSPGKWTPAQHVNHVVLVYESAVGDVRDGRPVRLIGTSRQRRHWRWLGLTQILWLDRLPTGAPSPHEFLPPAESPERNALTERLHAATNEFDSAMRQVWVKHPRHRVLHPYFGAVSLRQAIRICDVHTRHHGAALPV